MLPLASISPSVWAHIAQGTRGVFTDVDDTLTDKGVLVPAAYTALCALRSARKRVVLVTGRPFGWAQVLASIFPIDAAIAENGAVAALPDGNKIYFDDEAARVRGLRLRCAARAQIAHDVPQVRETRDDSLRELDLAYDVAEHERPSVDDVARVRTILEYHGLTTTQSSIHLHGSFSHADKAKMAVRVAAALWSESEDDVRRRYLFVGDSPNDAAAFAFFEHTIGVANVARHAAALAQMHASPWAVTMGCGGHGFAEVVTRLLSASY